MNGDIQREKQRNKMNVFRLFPVKSEMKLSLMYAEFKPSNELVLSLPYRIEKFIVFVNRINKFTILNKTVVVVVAV